VLDQLPAKLRAWSHLLEPTSDRVVVLVDLDTDNCVTLLAELNGLREQMNTPEYIVRIAIEEVEAWYLGDWEAVRNAFPKAQKKLHATYKQDSVCGTWEKFQEVIGDPLERKTGWAYAMGGALSVDGRNVSQSFTRFCNAVRRLAGESEVLCVDRVGEGKSELRRQVTKSLRAKRVISGRAKPRA
jgi:hypothetical protein